MHPQRAADRVQFGPLGERDARFAQYAPQPTAIAGTAHEDRSGVTYTEAREATAAMIRKMVKETTDAERIEALSNVVVDKPATESGARPSSFYPDGQLSVDAATERLSEHKKRADSNSQMMREMESTAYVATLFDRYSGNVISAMDARWVPEYGNRGELEAAIGAVISGLDGAMAQVAHMPVVHRRIPSTYGILRSMLNFYQSLQTTLRYRAVGAYPFNQLALTEDDLRMPTERERPHQWPDALAQTPITVIQSLRTHLFANLSVGNLRPDQHLPPGFEYQPGVRTFRGVDDLPILDGVNLSEEQVGLIYPAGVDIVGPSGSMGARAGMMSIRRVFRQPTESVLPETLPAFGHSVEQDDELMGQMPAAPEAEVTEGQSASAADPSLLAKPVKPSAVKQEAKIEKKDPTQKAKSVQFESKAEEVEPEVDPSGDAIMKDETTGTEDPSSVKKEEPVEPIEKPKPKARPAQKERINPGVPEPPLPPGTSPQAMRSAPVLAKSSAPSAPRPVARVEEPMLNRELYENTSFPLMPKFPEHNMALTSPRIRYTYDTVPVALPEYAVPGLSEHEDEDPILESYMHPPTMDQRKFSERVYKLISNKQHKALMKLMFYERGATANELGKLFEASTVEISENFRNANMAYIAEEAKVRMIGNERVRTMRLTETIKNAIPHDPRPDWGLVAFLEKEIVYAIGSMREFDRNNFPRSFKPPTQYKEATILPTWERYGASAILPLRDFLECLDHARDRLRVMKNQDTVELPNQYAAESYFDCSPPVFRLSGLLCTWWTCMLLQMKYSPCTIMGQDSLP